MNPAAYLNELLALGYLLASCAFIISLKRLGSPATARSGNLVGMLAMLIAVGVTLVDPRVSNYGPIFGAMAVGAVLGLVLARSVEMTQMPQMVALFNGLGGAASALVAIGELVRFDAERAALLAVAEQAGTGVIPPFLGLDAHAAVLLGAAIGAITLTGSVIAFAKLHDLMNTQPITFPGQNAVTGGVLFGLLLAIGVFLKDGSTPALVIGLSAAALVAGVLLVIPIGGADMPVVIALLNSYSGIAASMAGFALGNYVLIIAGALVGASGLILTDIMCRAMNRSIWNVMFGAFGATAAAGGGGQAGEQVHKETSHEDVAVMLAYANSVVFVPGYGLAVAQAQHEVRELADMLEAKGVQVRYAIHPVAGRMPGHMNVLLAEANVPYPKLVEMEDINPEFERTDVSVVIGANDVVNPAARSDTASPIYGMPILDVDKSKHVIILKRSMRPGFAGIQNQLFFEKQTFMLFGDAKDSLGNLISEVKEL